MRKLQETVFVFTNKMQKTNMINTIEKVYKSNKATDSWWEGSMNIFFVFLFKKSLFFFEKIYLKLIKMFYF